MSTNIYYSEYWYKISQLKVSILPISDIKKQVFRDKVYYIIHDPYNNSFFKISKDTYFFLVSLNTTHTIEYYWEKSLNSSAEKTPSQAEILELLIQLHKYNLLYFKNSPQSENIFNRIKKRESQEIKKKIFSFLFFKIPLWNPEPFLIKIEKIIFLIFSLKFFIIWLFTILLGLKLFIENYKNFNFSLEGLISPNNILILYVSIMFLKLFHELAHAMMTKRFGGEVHKLGIVFIVFLPLPFVDASSSWGFKNKWHRVLVSAAGIITDLFFAALSCMIWLYTDDGIVHSVAYNIMIIASISSLLFNGNPLLKFDAYYMLSDYLEIPNLLSKSKQIWLNFFERFIFNIDSKFYISEKRKENFILLSYGLLSIVYKLFISMIIILYVLDINIILGFIVACISIYLWILRPLYLYIRFLFISQKIKSYRFQKIVFNFILFFIITSIFTLVPFADSLKVSGILQSDDYENIHIQNYSILKNIHVRNGEKVKKGDLLFSFTNKELIYDLKLLYAKKDEINAYLLDARSNNISDLKSIKERINLIEHNIDFLEEKIQTLNVYAKANGKIYLHESINKKLNNWVIKNEKLAVLIKSNKAIFRAIIPQKSTLELFEKKTLFGKIKLKSNMTNEYESFRINIIPYDKKILPHAALAWEAGGDIKAISNKDGGLKTDESFYELRVILKNKHLGYFNRFGYLKIDLKEKTLLEKTVRFFKQLLQRRFLI